jgi:hypothetical protein
MPLPPSADNLTIPGGVRLHFGPDFDNLRNLGHFDPNTMAMRTVSEELKQETQYSGKIRVLKVFPISEEIYFDFSLLEPVIEHLRYYFKGGEATLDPVSGNPVFPMATGGYAEGVAKLEFHPSLGFQGNYMIPKCQLKPNGNLEFNPRETLKIPLTLAVLDNYDATPTTPYGYWESLNDDLEGEGSPEGSP